MSRLPADRLAGLLSIFGGLALGVGSWFIDINPNQLTLSARFFPGLLAGLLVVLGVLLALAPGPRPLGEVWAGIADRRAVLFAAALLIYFLTFRHVDFRLGTWLFMLVAMWLLGARRVWELLVIPTATALLVYVTFRYGFIVLLPTWT
jgi:putative tricarboxylic transport membrane protein